MVNVCVRWDAIAQAECARLGYAQERGQYVAIEGDARCTEGYFEQKRGALWDNPQTI